MSRKLICIKTQDSWGWGCSECEWMFNPSGSPIGESLDEMIQNYERQRDKNFAVHICAQHPAPRTKKVR